MQKWASRSFLRTTFIIEHFQWECARFRGSIAFVGSMSLVPSCNLLCWVFCGSKIFSCGNFLWPEYLSRGYIVGINVFLVGTLWVQNFFLWVFLGSALYYRGYFVGPIFFIVAIFMIQKFSVVGCIKRMTKHRNTKIYLKPRILFQINFNNCQFW